MLTLYLRDEHGPLGSADIGDDGTVTRSDAAALDALVALARAGGLPPSALDGFFNGYLLVAATPGAAWPAMTPVTGEPGPAAAFDPHQPRDEHGRWVKTGRGYAGPARPPHPRRDLLATLTPGDLARLDEAGKGLHSHAEGDKGLEEIARLQGFDRPPVRGTAEQLAAEEAAGGTRMYRGVDRPAYAAAWVSGASSRQGFGIAGNGTYFAASPGVARNYAGSHGTVIEGVLRYDANTIGYDQLAGDWKQYRRGVNFNDPGYLAASDLGRFAALRGYDAVAVDTGSGTDDTYILLNRGALLVQP